MAKFEKELDEECWDCFNLDGGPDECDNWRFFCMKGINIYNKNTGRCIHYDWNEVNDKPYYEYERE